MENDRVAKRARIASSVQDVIDAVSEEVKSFSRSMGTLPVTSLATSFSFENLTKTVQEHAPTLWQILSQVMQKPERNQIKNNEKKDTVITILMGLIGKFINNRCNYLSLFLGLFFVSKGTPESVTIFYFKILRKGKTDIPEQHQQVISVLNSIGLSDSSVSVGNWLNKRADGWKLSDWAKTEDLMIAFDNYNRNIPGRHLTSEKQGTMLNGTIRCYIKLSKIDRTLPNESPQKDISLVCTDDVRTDPNF